MQRDPGNGARGGETYPRLLDLIPNGSQLMERDGGGGGGQNDFGVVEEKKLELRLGPPGAEDWRVLVKEHKEDGASLGFLSGTSKCGINMSAGAKRGFMDTLECKREGFKQQQPVKAGFLHLASTPGTASGSLQQVDGTNTEQPQQSPEGKAGSAASSITPPASGKAVASRDRSQARTVAAPVVGWPPIRSFRKNLASSSSKPPSQPQNGNSGKTQLQEICGRGRFVKINMDGIPIGRKVDLKAYDSYEKLSSAVDELFSGLLAAQRETPALGNQSSRGPGQAIRGLLEGSPEYTLVYEDNEGDILLVGDVPWDLFVSAVKRLRVLKSSELSALSLAAGNRRTNAKEAEVQ